VDNSG
jgi:Ca2+-binding EF-hand superfamily protein